MQYMLLKPAARLIKLVVICALAMGSIAGFAAEPDAANAVAVGFKAVAHAAREGIEAAEAKDADALKHEYAEAHDAWEVFEDEVREADADAYVSLEGKLSAVKKALKAEPLDFAAAEAACKALEAECNAVAAKLVKTTVATPAVVSEADAAKATALAALVEPLRKTAELAHAGVVAAEANDGKGILKAFNEAHDFWATFEDGVREVDPAAYVVLERKIDGARRFLKVKEIDPVRALPGMKDMEAACLEYAAKFATPVAAAPEAAAPAALDMKARFGQLAHIAHEAVEAAEGKDAKALKHEYDEVHELWEGFEDAVREANAKVYVAMEDKMHGLRDQLKVEPVDFAAAETAAKALEAICKESAELFNGAPTTNGDAAAVTSGLLAEPMIRLAAVAGRVTTAAEAKDAATSRAAYAEADDLWASFEDGVRDANPGVYVGMEAKLHAVRDLLKVEPVDFAAVALASQALQAASLKGATTLGNVTATPVAGAGADTSANGAVGGKPKVEDFIVHMTSLAAALKAGDATTAHGALDRAVSMWPLIEGIVATKDKGAYDAIETDLGKALGALEAQPVDLAAADLATTRILTAIQPFAGELRYGVFDAASIILREGLEALLVLVALLAFLKKTGHADKQRWIWGGTIVGLIASVIVGVALHLIFNQAASGANREVMEGVIGLFAAAMLFYVSYWLHSQSSFHGWQKYMNERTTAALKSGSVTGLAVLAFLAVFREGGETVLFYLGMAPSISGRDLALGLGIGTGILVVVTVLVLGLGVRLPLRKFFVGAGILVYYLGFKFVGNGVHALQVADIIPPMVVPHLPTIGFFGIYPNWLSFGIQLALLVAAIVVIIVGRKRDQQARAEIAALGTKHATA